MPRKPKAKERSRRPPPPSVPQFAPSPIPSSRSVFSLPSLRRLFNILHAERLSAPCGLAPCLTAKIVRIGSLPLGRRRHRRCRTPLRRAVWLPATARLLRSHSLPGQPSIPSEHFFTPIEAVSLPASTSLPSLPTFWLPASGPISFASAPSITRLSVRSCSPSHPRPSRRTPQTTFHTLFLTLSCSLYSISQSCGDFHVKKVEGRFQQAGEKEKYAARFIADPLNA